MIVTLLPLLLPALDPKIPFILALCLQLLTPTCPLNSALRKKGNIVMRKHRHDIYPLQAVDAAVRVDRVDKFSILNNGSLAVAIIRGGCCGFGHGEDALLFEIVSRAEPFECTS